MKDNYKRKITPNQRQQLLQVYLHMGLEESRLLCVEFGVHRDYAAKHASELGKSHKKKFGGRCDSAVGVDHDDPRWARAVAIGYVVAP